MAKLVSGLVKQYGFDWRVPDTRCHVATEGGNFGKHVSMCVSVFVQRGLLCSIVVDLTQFTGMRVLCHKPHFMPQEDILVLINSAWSAARKWRR